MTTGSRQLLGRAAEETAAQFLQSAGLAVISRNYRRRAGELDIIARTSELLIVVEVRTRSAERFGGAAASVNRRKQLRITRAAAQLLQSRRDLAKLPVRFDVVVVRMLQTGPPHVQWIQHAFEA